MDTNKKPITTDVQASDKYTPGQRHNRYRRTERKARNLMGTLYLANEFSLQRRRNMTKRQRHIDNVISGRIIPRKGEIEQIMAALKAGRASKA